MVNGVFDFGDCRGRLQFLVLISNPLPPYDKQGGIRGRDRAAIQIKQFYSISLRISSGCDFFLYESGLFNLINGQIMSLGPK
jgi:hypothetical protein